MDTSMERTIMVCFADDGEADEPLRIAEGIAQQFKYLQKVLDGPGEFREAQQGEVRIKEVTRAIDVVVLQHELDIVDSLTKDNLLDAMIALDYLQFDTDQATTASSVLWRLHRRMVLENWLDDQRLASSLLDSFARYGLIALFIHQHKDICERLLPCVREKPDIVRDHWRACLRGGDGADSPAAKAAVSLLASLAEALSYDEIDIGREELGNFITNSTGSRSIAAAHGAAFEKDVFAHAVSGTIHPFTVNSPEIFTNDCAAYVAGLPRFVPPYPSSPPIDAIKDGETKLSDIAGWHVVVHRLNNRDEGEAYVTCYGVDGSLDVLRGDSTAIRLHRPPSLFTERIRMGNDESEPSVGDSCVKLLAGETCLHMNQANISADALSRQGVGGARLKDVRLNLTVKHFPMRVLALHYLRLCAKDGCWDEVTNMARSIHREVAASMFSFMVAAQHHRLALMLHWAAAVKRLAQLKADIIISQLQGDDADDTDDTDFMRENLRDVPAVLPILPILPILPSAVRTEFMAALKEALEPQNEDAFTELCSAFIERETTRSNKESADRRRLEAENERLRQEIDVLKEQVRRGTKRPRGEMEGHQQEGEG
ncbi:unnamed protein product [Vitrella brassicaformis CCMP3155]|uniref:Uncharacterized protein n=1 Tax=Vitrella brassicaformis (strain CCMP3155) TaxID=1169540 RepID=A0A0G4G7S0_VITBC|nr:unnamed protein product [Vitrella brassicaformis CCMP3155]|eukprot:CEM24543.1 unnamed protein product [Vitrella brassicaformis CCMP3155]